MKEWTPKELEQALWRREDAIVFFYTPLCGTCKLAERMLGIVEVMLDRLPLSKANVNFLPERAAQWEITSIPCLVVLKEGKPVHKLYAMHSVDDLYRFLKPYQRE
ncbi:thioredoxin family protein [Paenibacillus aurantius]|uniref:Thioredoxin family protein n=1 Tax=Paenibacillus aurantius TaxID=2918900 RepID=A0AA96RB43_9BACL|nr:thioredoxin family protein [Paenibacillus aurantius]WNQ09115.1 thioredoxin family protein [Paenibacillus aurantius]